MLRQSPDTVFNIGDTFYYPREDHKTTWNCVSSLPLEVAIVWLENSTLNQFHLENRCVGSMGDITRPAIRLLDSKLARDWDNKMAIVIERGTALYRHDDYYYILKRK